MKEETTLVLRTSDKDRRAYGGFQWPESGPVECPDWKPTAECGNGLHGILWPEGNWEDIKDYDGGETWQVIEVEKKALVEIGGKVKFQKGNVVYSGDFAVAFNMIVQRWLNNLPTWIKETAKDARDIKNDNGGYYARIGSSGDSAQIGSSGDSAQIDASGKNAVIACAGSIKKFKAGENGCIAAPWHDGNRTRFALGYVGENIKADTWYALNETGEFVEVNA